MLARPVPTRRSATSGGSVTITLELAEFTLAWRELGLGQCPLVLRTEETATTLAEAEDLDRRCRAALADRGLFTGPGEPHPDLDWALRLFAAPTHAVDVRWSLPGGRRLRAMAALSGQHAVIGVVGDGVLSIDPLRPTTVCEAAVSVLGAVPAGPGQVVNLPESAVSRAGRKGRSDADFEDALLDAGVRYGDARALLGMLGTDRVGAGQLGVSRWEGLGQRRRGPYAIDVIDTTRGRYAVHERDGWLTVAPVDLPRLAEMLRELLAVT